MKPKMIYAIVSQLVLAILLSASALAQQGVIQGKVKEQGGKALEGVRIRAVNAANKQDAPEARTDRKGAFELRGLSTGDYVLTFELEGFRTFVTRRLEVTSGETIRLRNAVEMSRERGPSSLVRGAVFDSDGFSLPNVSVTIERVGEGKRFKEEKLSGEGGMFAFRLPPETATYRITATARGFQPASKEISVNSDEIQHLALSLERIK
jgi:hypothetical protein